MLDRSSLGSTPLTRIKDIDSAVGCRVRQAREGVGLSQEGLSAWLGCTFQQVQKYEKGRNRIGPGRLAVVAEVTGRDLAWFFDAPTADAKVDYVLRTSGLFVRADGGVTAYVDEAQRFTREAALLRARADDSLTPACADDFAGDSWRSRASLIAELTELRARSS